MTDTPDKSARIAKFSTATPGPSGYQTHCPSRTARFWRAVGFRYHLGDSPDDVDALPGWMVTETRMHFGVFDRLRLLMTGRLYIRLTQHLPVECEFSRNRLDWHIKHPGERD